MGNILEGNFGKLYSTITLLFLLATGVAGKSATNSWIKPIDGKWEGAQAWSLGIAPNSTQSVEIQAVSPRTVTIDAVTIANRPLTMAVNDLTISRTNNLRINDPGTDNPLQITETLRLGQGALIQNGGYVQARRIYMSGGVYSLTNGLLNAAIIDFPYRSEFHQHGGITRFGQIGLPVGHYTLADGEMTVTNGIFLNGLYGPATFSQLDGTNRTGALSLYPAMGAGGSPMLFALSGGWLFSSNVRIGPRGSFTQTGGHHAVDGPLTLEGDARYYPPQPTPAIYSNTGSLTVKELAMNEFSTFSASGNTTVSGDIRLYGGMENFTTVSISDGVLSCSNVINDGGMANILQSGGAFVVSNLFVFSGYYPGLHTGVGARPARYFFSDGSFSAQNIELGAEWIIESSFHTGRIENPGYFKMAGILRVGSADEQLGRFILASNAIVDLGMGSAKLAFANSHAEAWNSTATLTVTNWDGALNGGGYDQLRFGINEFGLSATQVMQIRFVNPVGLPTGTYLSRILSTGEVVPLPTPAPALSREGDNLILTWSSQFALQAATNVAGPYLDIATNSTSYTNQCAAGSQSYFRLRLK